MTHRLMEQLFEAMFGIQDFFITKVEYNENEITLYVDTEKDNVCPKCSRSYKTYYDGYIRKIYAGTINLKILKIAYLNKRVDCDKCGIKTVEAPFSSKKKRYLIGFENIVNEYTRYLDNSSTAKLLGLSETTIYRMDKKGLQNKARDYKSKIPEIKEAGVDEVSIKRKHSYATIMVNQEDSKVIWAEKNRTKKSYLKMLRFLRPKLKNLEAVSMDFWKAYETGTKELFPDCKIIYDRFHLSRILNREIEQERRQYQKSLSDDDRKRMKKHTRWVLLKRKKNLSDNNEKHMNELKEKNEALYTMYILKEEFLSIFDKNSNRNNAFIEILNWINTIKETSYQYLKNFSKRVLKRIDKILNWFDKPISNGKSEGINNVIKTILKKAYGYKDFIYFRLKILQKCGYLMG